VKDSFRDMGWAASRSAFVHLYLNGLYWGIYQPSERLNASWFSRHHGGLEGAWDVIVGEDNNGPPVVVDGSVSDWQALLNLANTAVTSEAAYQAIAQRIDIDNLIDYMMVHIFAESEDWPRHNWYVAHRRETNGVPATKFICTVWDQELTLDRLVRRNRVEVGSTGGEIYSPARIYQQLRAWPEFRRQFGDRVHQHLFNDGALTPSNNVARLLAKAAAIRDAVIGESARWGDAREFTIVTTTGTSMGTGQTFTRDDWWQPEIDKLTTNFFQKLTADNVARFRAANLYPNLNAPFFNQFGGAVPAGFNLVVTHSNAVGTIFFTMDGSDPRTYGTGAVAPSAQAFSEPVPINMPTRIRARVFNAGQWSALVDATFFPPQDLSGLALTELMYNPPVFGTFVSDDLEFVELKNRGTNALNLSGLIFNGIGFTFTNGTVLAPGQFFVLARNVAAFGARYPGVVVNGIYPGRLDNGGEPLRISFPFGGNVLSVTYNDDVPWPLAADGFGFSLVQRSPITTQAPDNGGSWRASALTGGSPGADDPDPAIPAIYVNEALTIHAENQENYIELFNASLSSANIAGWFLTDDRSAPFKFRISDGTTIDAEGFVVFPESEFNPQPGSPASFTLNSHGGRLYLFSADASTNLTGYSHGFEFDAQDERPFGRVLNSAGEEFFPAQIEGSPNMPNGEGAYYPPVIINEIHYHPTAGGDEFIELRRTVPDAVAFYDPVRPTNRWRMDGIDFTFPDGFELESEFCLLVATNPAAFRAKYNVPAEIPLLGPWSGNLQDSGERLRLQRPDVPDTNGFGLITVDEVRYNDRGPWPAVADGAGASLHRESRNNTYGNEPLDWFAALPTPGSHADERDSDFDGMSDAWELTYGTQVSVPDADGDLDGDGYLNLNEFIAGTLPNDNTSFFKVFIQLTPTAEIYFQSVAGRVYSVARWFGLPDDFGGAGDEIGGTGGIIRVPLGTITGNSFYSVTVRRE
jgi:hypothetical protein